MSTSARRSCASLLIATPDRSVAALAPSGRLGAAASSSIPERSTLRASVTTQPKAKSSRRRSKRARRRRRPAAAGRQAATASSASLKAGRRARRRPGKAEGEGRRRHRAHRTADCRLAFRRRAICPSACPSNRQPSISSAAGVAGRSCIMAYKVAVVGATGNVGREMLDILAERRFPVSEVVALASPRSIGIGGLLRRQDAEVQGARHLRLLRHRYLSDVGGRRRRPRNGRPGSARRAASSSTIPRPGAWTPTCRWSCRR